MVVRSSLEEKEVASPLLKRYLPFPGLSSFVDPFVASILTRAAHFRARHPPGQSALLPTDHDPTATPAGACAHSTTVVLQPKDHEEVSSAIPQGPPSASLPDLEPHSTRRSPSPSKGLPAPRKKMGSPLANPGCHSLQGV
ncbi:hypothetical protein LIER_34642 [Lithospermum erythrorhizon]|uniref:Uncharacterized protein n=1 Tax=Lithospermum erythrorhizon TaxID=34254 RepID=A0AAV3S3B1_LITER